MEDKNKAIEELFTRLEQLTRQQKIFQAEIYKLTQDLHRLTSPDSPRESVAEIRTATPVHEEKTDKVLAAQEVSSPGQSHYAPGAKKERRPWEEFIGTNLLNKVGIAVLVLGIGFGTKYSIDNRLINPLTRIILGYLSGIILIGLAFPLRTRHAGFSAVLLSGGMAVLYFITYAAYSFYGLIPQVPAFILMVLFTLFTVFASVRYNLEVISIIALVGAYAVPILLSDGSGRVVILFSYISIINAGILVLSFKKYWKRLFYLSFILTWLTYASWYAFSYEAQNHAGISLLFSVVFFITFYITFLAYKLLRSESLSRGDVVCMLVNAFIFYGYGYLTIESLQGGDQFLGLFTVGTACVHFVAGLVIYKTQSRLNDIFYFVAGMVLIFLTIAVPVQLEGNWVTLVWAGEAALLFWIGRSKSFPTYEKLSYPLIVLAFASLLHDWSDHYYQSYYYNNQLHIDFTIFLNVQFLTSMLVGGALIFILFISRQNRTGIFKPDSSGHAFFAAGLPILAVVVFYGGFYKEIEMFWNLRFAASSLSIQGSDGMSYDQHDHSLLNFKTVWLTIFSAAFAAALCVMQLKWRTHATAFACLAINGLVLLVFMTSALLDLTELREAYLQQNLAAYYGRGAGHLIIRYLAILAILPLLWFNRRLIRQEFFNDDARKAENLFLHLVVIVLLSSELIHWLDLARVENSFRLSLSILWGIYALMLIVFGLSRDLRHIRVGGMVLFGATLIKLFAYDMAGMSTILKTVVMIILGVLLLTASFIYNKYKRSAGNEAS
jgi:hypothetical protein